MAGSQEPLWKEALRRDSVGEKVAQVALNSGKGGSSGLILSSRGRCLPGKGALGVHVKGDQGVQAVSCPCSTHVRPRL